MRLFVISHGLARYCLSVWRTLAGDGRWIHPGAWRFRIDELGKPYARLEEGGAGADALPLYNLSHTRGAAVVAVMRACHPGDRLGVDVESKARTMKAVPLAERYFAKEEVADVIATGDATRANARFIRYWTLKEAYLKATGAGLTKPLASFAFKPSEKGAELLYDKTRDGSPDWKFFSMEFENEYRVSLAVSRRKRENESHVPVFRK